MSSLGDSFIRRSNWVPLTCADTWWIRLRRIVPQMPFVAIADFLGVLAAAPRCLLARDAPDVARVVRVDSDAAHAQPREAFSQDLPRLAAPADWRSQCAPRL